MSDDPRHQWPERRGRTGENEDFIRKIRRDEPTAALRHGLNPMSEADYERLREQYWAEATSSGPLGFLGIHASPPEPATPLSFDDILALYDKLTPAPRQPSAYRAHPDTFASLPRAKPSPSASLDALLGVPVIPDPSIPVGQFKAEHYWPHEPAEGALEPPEPGDTDTDQHEAGTGRWKTILAVLGIVVVGVAVIVGFAAAAIFYGAGRWW